ncbi:hypothetical protein GH714_004782 [Hevea brasiliensis]|uniref:Uncharacterized protein n=1 Tax=Hevea brasiliensis TaxID=3981 RepID=A0A6A6KD97_HEVBR|nr:hypothetical protein GH714_004782 [Hevea brasiliensis]
MMMEEPPSDRTRPFLQQLEKPYKIELKGINDNRNISELDILDLTLSSSSSFEPQVPFKASSSTTLHKQEQIKAPSTAHVERWLKVAPANSSSAGALKVIDLAQSDGQEENSVTVSEDSDGDVDDICSSCSSNWPLMK